MWIGVLSFVNLFCNIHKNVVGMLHACLPQTKLSRNIEEVLLDIIPCTYLHFFVQHWSPLRSNWLSLGFGFSQPHKLTFLRSKINLLFACCLSRSEEWLHTDVQAPWAIQALQFCSLYCQQIWFTMFSRGRTFFSHFLGFAWNGFSCVAYSQKGKWMWHIFFYSPE